MKNNAKRVLAVITAFVLIILILSITNSFVGNPISKHLSDKSSAKYINEKYSDLNLQADKSVYNFKDKQYIVSVKSKDSIDTYFDIYCNYTGRVLRDDYNTNVTEGFNTWSRVNNEYSRYVEKLLKDKLKYHYNMITVKLADKEIPKLEIDKKYDMHDKNIQGSVSIYLYSDNCTWENAAEVLREIDRVLSEDKLNVESYSISLDNKDKSGDSIGVCDFDKKLLESDNLPSVMEEHYKQSEK